MEVVGFQIEIKVKEVVGSLVWEAEAGEIVFEDLWEQGEVFGIKRMRRQFIFAESGVKVSQQGG